MAVRAILYFVVTALLSFVFLFAGGTKLTDAIDAKLHAEHIVNFGKYNKLVEGAGVNIPNSAQNFRLFTGALEVACAVLLWIPGFSGIANYLLVITMIGAVGAHYAFNEPFIAPAVLGGLLLVRRFLVAPSTKKKSH